MWELSIPCYTVPLAFGQTVKFRTADYPLALLWKGERSSNCVTSSKQGGISQEPVLETLLMIFNTNKKKKRRASSYVSYLK